MSIKENHDTVYWCKIFGAPETNQKNHIIGFEPILNRNHKSLVHHMTLFECSILDVNSKDLDVWTTSAGLVCNSEESNSYSIWGSCITPVAAWSVGSNGQSFPSHVGEYIKFLIVVKLSNFIICIQLNFLRNPFVGKVLYVGNFLQQSIQKDIQR